MTHDEYKATVKNLIAQKEHHKTSLQNVESLLAQTRREYREQVRSERAKKAVCSILTPSEHQTIVEAIADLDPRACRACNNVRGNKPTKVHGVTECAACGALFGTCYLGESYEFVSPYMTAANVPPEQTRYYDFTTLGSEGVGRRHGWYDPATKLVTQVG